MSLVEIDHQCARCGSSVYPEPCSGCGGCGHLHGEAGHLTCDLCDGEGVSEFCLSTRTYCRRNPLPGRLGIPRGLVEEFEITRGAP